MSAHPGTAASMPSDKSSCAHVTAMHEGHWAKTQFVHPAQRRWRVGFPSSLRRSPSIRKAAK